MTAKPEPNCTCRYVLRTPDHPPGVIRDERCQIHGDGVLLEGLTEPKPQAVVTDKDRNAAGMIYGTGTAIPNGERIYESACNVIAAYRVEIEAQAKRDVENGTPIRDAFNRGKRDGAREALEKGAKAILAWCDAADYQGLAQILRDLAEEWYPLIEPTPVEPEVRPDIPLYRCGKCGYCGPSKIHSGGFVVCEYEAVPLPPPAPSKAEELLPLGHEFVEGLSTCQSGLDPKRQCHVVVSPQVECGQLEPAHRGKRGGE